jgi:hypothetical protein
VAWVCKWPDHKARFQASMEELFTDSLKNTEQPILTRARRLYVPEDGILHSPRRGNLKSYKDQSRSLHNRTFKIIFNHFFLTLFFQVVIFQNFVMISSTVSTDNCDFK